MHLERIRDVKINALKKDAERQIKQSERELAAKIRGSQDFYKFAAVFLPPIPPILLAFFVFFHRRKAEQEGVDTRRLRYGKPKEAAVAVK
jgi:ABC-2 type transport system permease protein